MPTFADSVAALDRARADFQDALAAFAPDARAAVPASGGWSAEAVAEHLMLVERGLVHGIERQLAAGAARRDLGPVSDAALGQVIDGLESPRRFQVPPAAAPFIAPTGTRAEQVRAEWDALATRWHALADQLPDALAATGIVRHPLAGPVTAEGAARFATAHVRHHRFQLNRLAGAPEAAPQGSSDRG